MKITYVGHATLLLELAGTRILTDPNFDDHLGRFLPRVSAPGIALDALPRLDALLVTSLPNVACLTALFASAAGVVVTRDQTALITDGARSPHRGGSRC